MDKARIPVKLHRRVCLIQTEDAVLAEEVLANRKLAQDIVGRIADRILLIRPGRADDFRSSAEKLFFHVFLIEPAHDLLVKPPDDRLRRLSRRKHGGNL